MRISDWISDVCSSDLAEIAPVDDLRIGMLGSIAVQHARNVILGVSRREQHARQGEDFRVAPGAQCVQSVADNRSSEFQKAEIDIVRSEERRGGKECVSTGRTRGWPYP